MISHFRTRILRGVGGWDAWNVTEDADLGLRLARFGWQCEVLDSTTYEEAPVSIGQFLRQRMRWIKGWMQTAFVHGRDPVRLWRDLGSMRVATLLAQFCGGIIGPMCWPVFASALIVDVALNGMPQPAGITQIATATLSLSLATAGLGAMLWPLILGMRRQRIGRLWPCLLLLPAWHVLLCIAGWRALIDLVRNPFGWAKTDHGLSANRNRPS